MSQRHPEDQEPEEGEGQFDVRGKTREGKNKMPRKPRQEEGDRGSGGRDNRRGGRSDSAGSTERSGNAFAQFAKAHPEIGRDEHSADPPAQTSPVTEHGAPAAKGTPPPAPAPVATPTAPAPVLPGPTPPTPTTVRTVQPNGILPGEEGRNLMTDPRRPIQQARTAPSVPAAPSATAKVMADVAAAQRLIDAEEGMAALRQTLGEFATETPQYQELARVVAELGTNDGVRAMAQALNNKTMTEGQLAAEAEEHARAERRHKFEAAVALIHDGAIALHSALTNGGGVALEVRYLELHSQQTRFGHVRVEFNGGAMTVTATAPLFLLERYGKTRDGRGKNFTLVPSVFTAKSGPELHTELLQALQNRWNLEERDIQHEQKIAGLRTRSQALQTEEKARLASGTSKTIAEILAGKAGDKVWVNPRVRLFYPDGNPVLDRGTGQQATGVMTYHIMSDGIAITLKEVVAYRVPDALSAIIGKPVLLADLEKQEYEALKGILDNRAHYEKFVRSKIASEEGNRDTAPMIVAADNPPADPLADLLADPPAEAPEATTGETGEVTTPVEKTTEVNEAPTPRKRVKKTPAAE